MSKLLTQRIAIVATTEVINAGATGSSSTDVVDLSKFGTVAFILKTGECATTSVGTLTVYSGSAAGTVTTTVGTVSTGANADDKQWIYEVPDYVLTQGHRYVKGVIAVTTATGYYDVCVIADRARIGPASDADLASVTVSVAS